MRWGCRAHSIQKNYIVWLINHSDLRFNFACHKLLGTLLHSTGIDSPNQVLILPSEPNHNHVHSPLIPETDSVRHQCHPMSREPCRCYAPYYVQIHYKSGIAEEKWSILWWFQSRSRKLTWKIRTQCKLGGGGGLGSRVQKSAYHFEWNELNTLIELCSIIWNFVRVS